MHPLLRALRAWVEGSPPPALPEGVSLLAAEHRLAGALYHIRPPLSDTDGARCEAAWAQNVAGHLLRVRALEERWPETAPAPLVIKGADLAENVYGDPGARAAVDLDLLLPAREERRVGAALAAVADSVTLPDYERWPAEAPCGRGYHFSPILLELHAAPQPEHRARLTGAALWPRGRMGRLGSVAVRYPTPVDRVLIWITNQAKGSFSGDLADLLDFALLLRDQGAGFAEIAARATETGLRRPYEVALLRLGASGIWPWELPAVRDPGARAAARVAGSVLGPPLGPGHLRTLRRQALKLWLCDGRGRLGTVARGAWTIYSQVSGTKTMSPG